jgi:hypothetical protein
MRSSSVSLLDWTVKRGVETMVKTYGQTRANGHTHTESLLAVLNSFARLSEQQRANAWDRLHRTMQGEAPDDQFELHQLVFTVLYEVHGPFDDETTTRISDTICEVLNERT